MSFFQSELSLSFFVISARFSSFVPLTSTCHCQYASHAMESITHVDQNTTLPVCFFNRQGLYLVLRKSSFELLVAVVAVASTSRVPSFRVLF
jgi:hypothetical protein